MAKNQLTNDIKRTKEKLKVFECKGFTQVVADIVEELTGKGAHPVEQIVSVINKTRAIYEKQLEELEKGTPKFEQGSMELK